MKITCTLGLLLCAFAQSSTAQPKTFAWTRASDEAVRLDPADYHTGRVYRPGPGGGNMHIDVQSKQPVTIAMAFADDWNNALQHPDPATLSSLTYRCVREHVTTTTYECHLPSERPMVLIIQDERTPDRAILTGIVAVLNRGAKKFISPNDLTITYYSWTCVNNCIQPEYQWFRLVKEKYELTSVPKIYSLLTPERDGQRLSVKIKAPVPMTIAVLPSKFADQIYDKPETLSSGLGNTACKQRGVQSLTFDCHFNLTDGPQSLVIKPDASFSGHKKAEIELQTVRCVANCSTITQ
jgi:hypothetical protein